MRFWPFRSHETRAEPAVSSTFLVAGGQVRSLADPTAELREIFGIAGVDGIPSGDDAAMKCSASAACMRLISTAVAECPLHAYGYADDGGRVRDRTHPADALLTGFACPWQAGTEFLRNMTLRALLEGEAFARVVRVRGEVRELHHVRGVTVERDDATGEPIYKVPRKGGGHDQLNFRDVLHLESPNGSAPAKQAARAIQLALTLEKQALDLFRNGGRPSAILSFKGRLDPDTEREIASSFDEAMTTRAGKAIPIGGGAEYIPLTMTSTDAEFIANRKLQTLEIARFFGVSPTLLAELEDASLNNSEALGRQFLSYTLAPWLTAWVAAISRCLIDPKSGRYVEFETGGLVSADLRARFEALRQAVGGPWLLPNEARALENRSSVDGGDRLNQPQGAPAASASSE